MWTVDVFVSMLWKYDAARRSTLPIDWNGSASIVLTRSWWRLDIDMYLNEALMGEILAFARQDAKRNRVQRCVRITPLVWWPRLAKRKKMIMDPDRSWWISYPYRIRLC